MMYGMPNSDPKKAGIAVAGMSIEDFFNQNPKPQQENSAPPFRTEEELRDLEKQEGGGE